MKALKTTFKFIASVSIIASVVAMAENYYDQKFYSYEVMAEREVPLTIEVDTEFTRNVASSEKKFPIIQEVLMKDAGKINGVWNVTRLVDDKSNVVFDMNNNFADKDGNIEVKMELVSDSTVMINNDEEQVYKISLLTEKGTLTLFKPFGIGYEIVEARFNAKESNREVVKSVKKQEVAQTKEEKRSALQKGFDEDLVLISALDIKKSREVMNAFKGQIEGRAYYNDGYLEIEGVVLHKGSKEETLPLRVSADVKDFGAFNDGEVHGMVTSVTETELKITLSTGPIANAMLNFRIQSKFDEERQRLEDEKYEQSLAQEEKVVEVADAKIEKAGFEF